MLKAIAVSLLLLAAPTAVSAPVAPPAHVAVLDECPDGVKIPPICI